MKIPTFKILKNSQRATIIAGAGVLFVVFGGTSAYAAKSNALPGSALYPLKQLWENGQLLLSFSPTSKAQTQVSIAQDRIKAVQVSPAPTTVIVPALQEAQQQLSGAVSQAGNITDPTQKKEIKDSITKSASEAEAELEQEKESESASENDKTDIQHTSDEVKKVKDQASTDN